MPWDAWEKGGISNVSLFKKIWIKIFGKRISGTDKTPGQLILYEGYSYKKKIYFFEKPTIYED